MKDQAITNANRCLRCAIPSCSKACPLHNDIPQINECVCNGNYDKAMQLIGHPFGEVCSYVCPHEVTCTGNCVLNAKHNPVQPCLVERLVYQQANYSLQISSNLLSGKTVAVIGGGVAGITFACLMHKQGANVTIFSDDLLSTIKMISTIRLPSTAITKIEDLLKTNKIKVENCFVDNQKFSSLVSSNTIVYVATGLDKQYTLDLPNEKDCTVDAFAFLRSGKVQPNTNVAVIGGGNTAMDCALKVASCGAKATILYRRQLQDMPAFTKEVETALQMGTEFVCNVAPVSLQKENDNVQVTLCQTLSQGRGKLQLITDKTQTMQFDTVVTALGASSSNEFCLPTENGKVVVDEYGKVVGSKYNNVYAGGDITQGQNLVAVAVAKAISTAKHVVDSFSKE